MISETLEFAKSHNYNKLGLLATKKTIESGLYSERAEKLGISIVNPSEESNKRLSSAIHSFLQNGLKEEQQEAVLSAVSELVDEGVEAVILGCTDLKAILNKRSIDVPLVDSLCVLTDVAVRALSGGE
ncbi:MAG: hypothetical protein D6797_05765 [Bdellovibrio sp.]|nr:MAG: hypothetical protein D6797_05765 [Bdellovibrio sp.]